MEQHKHLNALVGEFGVEGYVLGGGLAVAVQTETPRKSSDIDLIVLSDDVQRKLEGFSARNSVKVDATLSANYLGSIAFSYDLLHSNTERLLYNGVALPCLSKEALLVSKLTSLILSDTESPVTAYGASVLRSKDVIDIRQLMAKGIDPEKTTALIGAVPHLEENDARAFYDVAAAVLGNSSLPAHVVRNAYGIARIGSFCPESADTLISEAAAQESLNTGTLALKLLRFYPKCWEGNIVEAYRETMRETGFEPA